VSTVEDLRPVLVKLGGVRGGPNVRTLRRDRWWASPTVTVCFLTAFIVYSTWAVFQNAHYYVGAAAGRDLISPFYSPCLTYSCGLASGPGHGFIFIAWWTISPGILVLAGPLGFRATCYYYRKAYYRSFWQSPPACGVADGHGRYSGESRYFFFIALVFNTILTIDAVMAFRLPGDGGIGVSVGTLVLVVNAVLLWLYTLSCHACRHMCGGNVDQFSRHRVRHRIWQILTPLNARHMQLAWASLTFVALADLYVRLVASGTFHDPKIF
jgi:hypothetical protein